MSIAELPIAVRAYVEPLKRARRRSRRLDLPLPRLALFIDTETTTDQTQRFLFGWYRLCELEWTPDGVRVACIEEGIIYADELPRPDAAGLAELRRYVKAERADVAPGSDRRIALLGRSGFVEQVLYPAAYEAGALMVAFNLPFDLSRLAIDVGAARGSFFGGFSLTFAGYPDGRALRGHPWRPRIAVRALDGKRALIGWKRPRSDGRRRRNAGGEFLDLRTLIYAHTDTSHSLASACKAFGLDEGKLETEEYGKITTEFIRYARRDTEVLPRLFERVIAEHRLHPITLDPAKALSPAAIGKAYLRAAGIDAVLARQPRFSSRMLGYGMVAYYGGRSECRIRRLAVPVRVLDFLSEYPETVGYSECRIRRLAVPVRVLDFLSEYPTVSVLMRVSQLLCAERIEAEDCTRELRELLAGLTPEQLFDREVWKGFLGLVRVRSNGAVTPARVRYDAGGTWQIGVNPLAFDGDLWYAIPDVVASALYGRPPEVVEAVRFVPRGTAPSLGPTSVRGAAAVDPRGDDIFRALIEYRQRIAQAAAPEAERVRQATKIVANSAAYGIAAELNRRGAAKEKRERCRIHGAERRPLERLVHDPELPGEYFFSPLAACVAGAGRLLLALLEARVRARGGTFAFCDTDSMAVVSTRTGGEFRYRDERGTARTIHALSRREVEDIREEFARLSPYDRAAVPGSILKLEHAGTEDDGGLCCYAVSAKRYALFRRRGNEIEIVKASKHGLGHLLDPRDPLADDEMRQKWIEEVWGLIVGRALGLPQTEPAWLDRPAVGRFTVSTAELLRAFNRMDRDKPYPRRVKPFNFLLTAHLLPLGRPTDADIDRAHFQLVAPWERDARRWGRMHWIDRYSGRTYAIATRGQGGRGLARVMTYREYLALYESHPESKSLGPDGEPCGRATVGELQRRAVHGTSLTYVGKESNRLDEREAGLVTEEGDFLVLYETDEMLGSAMRRLTTRELVARSGLNRSTIKRLRSGRVRPRRSTLARLSRALRKGG